MMVKHAYVTCDQCGKDFRSMTMIPEGANVQKFAGTQTDCPHCGKATSMGTLSWKQPSAGK